MLGLAFLALLFGGTFFFVWKRSANNDLYEFVLLLILGKVVLVLCLIGVVMLIDRPGG